MITGFNRRCCQHEHFSKIILVRFFSSFDPFFLFCSSSFLWLYSPPVLILCISPLLLKSNSRMSSRILCLPNLISKQHSLLLFQKGRFLQNLFSWVIFACCSIPSTGMLSTRKAPKLTSLFLIPKKTSIKSSFHQVEVRIDFDWFLNDFEFSSWNL